MESVREQLQIFSRRFGLLNASCCDECCGEQVSMAQSHILFEVRRSGNPSMQQVAQELGVDVTTFSRQVKTLEIKALVCRKASPDDGRVTLLGLTIEGTRVLERIDSFMAVRLQKIFDHMTSFERETVVRSLELLNKTLNQAARDSGNQEGIIACCK